MKKLFLALLFMCLLLCGCIKKEEQEPQDDLSKIIKRGEIIIGIRDDTMPFGFRDKDGNMAGFDIDLAKIIAKNILGDESKIQFVPVTASNRISKLISGEVDILIATMTITEQREQILNFSIPYYIAGQAILTKSTSKATGLLDFQDKKLIVVFGSTSERNLRTNVPDIEILGYKTYKEAYNALKEGKADGIVADDTILLSYALNDKSVKLLPKRFSQEPYAVAFRKENESLELIERIDYIIDSLQSSGRIDKMLEKWNIK